MQSIAAVDDRAIVTRPAADLLPPTVPGTHEIVAAAGVVGVYAGPADEEVPALAAGQAVGAELAAEPVVAAVSEQAVVAGAAVDAVVAAEREDHLGPAGADDCVSGGRAKQHVDASPRMQGRGRIRWTAAAATAAVASPATTTAAGGEASRNRDLAVAHGDDAGPWRVSLSKQLTCSSGRR